MPALPQAAKAAHAKPTLRLAPAAHHVPAQNMYARKVPPAVLPRQHPVAPEAAAATAEADQPAAAATAEVAQPAAGVARPQAAGVVRVAALAEVAAVQAQVRAATAQAAIVLVAAEVAAQAAEEEDNSTLSNTNYKNKDYLCSLNAR